jgi:hypothetical protein
VQYIKAEIYNSVIAQSEELFSDLIGLLLFGESYLHAFKYLISPQLGRTRSREYPDTRHRAKILHEYAITLGVTSEEYAENFLADELPSAPHAKLIITLADEATKQLLPEVFQIASSCVAGGGIKLPSADKTAEAERAFRDGVPLDGPVSMGDLINAAWRIFESNGEEYLRDGRRIDDALADLVLKSVELHELRKYMP